MDKRIARPHRPVLIPVLLVLLSALLVAGFVLRLAHNGNLDKLPGIALALAGACLPVAVALVAVWRASRPAKSPPAG